MCVCGTKLRATKPPQSYGSVEGEGDIELLVGWDPVWRFAAQKDILSSASPVFEALFQGPLATSDSTVAITDVDPRAFHYLLLYLDGKEVKLQSVAVALNTLYAAHKYLVAGLAQICVNYLTDCLAVDSALDVFQHARRYAGPCNAKDSPGHERKHYTPTAPAPPAPDTIEGGTQELVRWSEVLLTKCLEFVDTHAEEVLRLEDFEDLEAESVGELLGRDSLDCPELVIWTSLERWSERECRRKKLSPTPEHRREVLGNLIYLVRLLTFTTDEFVRGPYQSDCIDPEDVKYLLANISGAPLPVVPTNLKPHLVRIQRRRTPRIQEPLEPNLKRSESWCRSKKWLKPSKDKKKSSKADKEKRCSGSCIADYMVDVLACIFD